MKKIVGIFFLLTTIIFAKGYNITPEQIERDVFEVNTIIFDFEELEKWNLLINGTISAETMYGRYIGDGILGLTQVSKAGYNYVEGNLNDEDRRKLMILGCPKKIKFEELRRNNKIAIIYCSFYYKYKLKGIPPKNLKECAKTWKKYYNTSAGDGTPKEFIIRYEKYGPKCNK